MLDEESVAWPLNDGAEDPAKNWVAEADDAYAAMVAGEADADDDGRQSDGDAEHGDAPDAEAGGEDQAEEGRYPQRAQHPPNQAHLFVAKGEQPVEDLLEPPRSCKEAMKIPESAEWGHFEVKHPRPLQLFLGQEVEEVAGEGLLLKRLQYAKNVLHTANMWDCKPKATSMKTKHMMPKTACVELKNDVPRKAAYERQWVHCCACPFIQGQLWQIRWVG